MVLWEWCQLALAALAGVWVGIPMMATGLEILMLFTYTRSWMIIDGLQGLGQWLRVGRSLGPSQRKQLEHPVYGLVAQLAGCPDSPFIQQVDHFPVVLPVIVEVFEEIVP